MKTSPYPRRNGKGYTQHCCCTYGAAVSGEWPEFQCYHCARHTDPIMANPSNTCRRHAGLSVPVKEAFNRAIQPVPEEKVRASREMLEKLTI